MQNKQIVFLFISNVAILFIGMGLFPLLPLYAAEFGATHTQVGIYLGVTYVSIAAGTMLSGWLAGHFTRKRTLLAAGVLGVPALVLLGQATALWQVTLLTAAVWFAGGVGLTLVSVFTGLVSEGKKRGRSFSLMSMGSPLGAVVGGTTVGQLVAWRGYPLMFAVLAGVWAVIPVAVLLGVRDQDQPVSRPARSTEEPGGGRPRLGRTFYLLLSVSLFSALAVNTGRLGTTLSMQNLHFSASAVASTATVSGLVAIPVVLLVGALSDRLGRKSFLTLSYGLAAAGVLTLGLASQLWHFWLAASLLLAARSADRAVASALATDMLTPEALGRGLPRLNAMQWLAGILSFTTAGYVIDTLGASPLYLVAAALAGLAALGVSQVGRLRPEAQPEGLEGWKIGGLDDWKIGKRFSSHPAIQSSNHPIFQPSSHPTIQSITRPLAPVRASGCG